MKKSVQITIGFFIGLLYTGVKTGGTEPVKKPVKITIGFFTGEKQTGSRTGGKQTGQKSGVHFHRI